MKPQISIFIFRRDFRVHDNLGLLKLIASFPALKILPIFIFNPLQASPTLNSYYNSRQFRFMVEALQDLSLTTNLVKFHHGSDTAVLQSIMKEYTVKAVAFNTDITPFARKRDKDVKDWCRAQKITCIEAEDYTLFPITSIKKGRSCHTVFFPFVKEVSALPKPRKADLNEVPISRFVNNEVDLEFAITNQEMMEMAEAHDLKVPITGTKAEADKIVRNLKSGLFDDYAKTLDKSAKPTTLLAAYMKFGLVSCRQIYEAMLGNYAFIEQLYWREFYFHLTWHLPKILEGQNGGINQAMKFRMQNLKWNDAGGDAWKAWSTGTTWQPFVDAGIRQLLATGEMHFRARMVSAMFLTRCLKISWHEGEKFFAQHLLDYDPAQNSGGWHRPWSGSNDVDTKTFNNFNAWIHMKKFDADCVYVKKWVPELRRTDNRDILGNNNAIYKSVCKRFNLAPN